MSERVTRIDREAVVSELRREAAKWALSPFNGEIDRYNSGLALANISRCLGFKGSLPKMEELYIALADLIEPATCRMVPFEAPGHLPNGVQCTNCGETFMFGCGDWGYCPRCGAEVGA